MPKTYTIPADLLRTLIDAADFGADQKGYDADVAEKEGMPEQSAELNETAEQWTSAVSAALNIERAT
jgi:hypothetical protein